MSKGVASLKGLAHIRTFGSVWGSNQPLNNSSVHRDLFHVTSKKNILLQQIEYTAARYDSLTKQLNALEDREAYLFHRSAMQRGIDLSQVELEPAHQTPGGRSR